MTKKSKSGEDKAAAKAGPKSQRSAVSKLDALKALLVRDGGASLQEMMEATGWQQHSVRGALAGSLKKQRGLVITSDKTDGVRRYSASLSADAQ